MAHAIPLIRAAVVLPFLRWMQANGRPAHDHLSAVGLGFVCPQSREAPVPLFSVFALFRLMARLEGPDIGVRVISPASLRDLGNFGQVVIAARSPREALRRVQAALPRYSTHEQISIWPVPHGQRLRAGWSMALDDETVHLTQQYTAGLVMGLCAATGLPDAAPCSLRIRPHPRHGIDHLRPWFGDALRAAYSAPLEVDLDDTLLDAPLQFGTDAPASQPDDWEVLKGDGSFAHSARLALDCIPPKAVTIEELADLAGMSARSVQRALAADGTSFRRLLDEARQAKAIERLAYHTGQLGTIAEELGYSQLSALSRAVRRWTGATPGKLRSPSSRSRHPQ